MKKNDNPCLGCEKIDICRAHGSYCKRYRAYIVRCWERYKTYPRRMMDTPAKPYQWKEGVFSYPHPVQAQDYLSSPPCKKCVVAQCDSPCLRLREWREIKFSKRVREENSYALQ